MARFVVPHGWVLQAYRFAVDPNAVQLGRFVSHAGGARFAYNAMLAVVKANFAQRAAERSYGIAEDALTPAVSWSFQSLRNDWNQRKHFLAISAAGEPWWQENSKEVYANACKALADGLGNWVASKTGSRAGRPIGFPKFKVKTRAPQVFSFTTGGIRIDPDRRHITLPRIGSVKTFESTRKLARRLDAGTARILRACVRYQAGRWWVSLQCVVERDNLRPAHVKPGADVVGIDLGVRNLVVVADPLGNELARHQPTRPMLAAQHRLRALQRKAARQVGPWEMSTKTHRTPSNGWRRTQQSIGRAHAQLRNLRIDQIHKLTTSLVQTHSCLVVEDLSVRNMMAAGGVRKRGLNRKLAEASLGTILRQLDYKAGWYGSRTVLADKWFPSSKLCSGCGVAKTKLRLAERTYRCEECGLVIDRDLNAAVNLARYCPSETDPSAGVVTGGADRNSSSSDDVGGAEARTRAAAAASGCGGGSADSKEEAA